MNPPPGLLLLGLWAALLAGCAPVGVRPDRSDDDVAGPAARPPAGAESPSAGDAPRDARNDWPDFLGAGRDARSAERGLLVSWPEAGPPLVWHREVGEGYATPVVSAGRLFHFDRHGDAERLTCLSAETGEELWRRDYPTRYEDMYGFGNGPRASPVVDGDRVYIHGAEGRLRCHRVTDGDLLWELQTSETYGVVTNFFGVGSTPVVAGDLLIVPVGGSPPGSPDIFSPDLAGDGTGLVAFDTQTGDERWRSTDALASYSSPVVTAVGGRPWGLYLARGGLLGFDPASGERRFLFPWRARKIESVNAATPLVVGDTVLITESYGPGSALLRLDGDGFEVLRRDRPRQETLKAHWATPVYHEGVVYGCHGSGSGEAELRAIEHRSGAKLWGRPGLARTTLIYADGHLIVLTENGRLLLIRATGEAYHEVASVVPSLDGVPLLRHPAWGAPVLAQGRLYLLGKGLLACLDVRGAASS